MNDEKDKIKLIFTTDEYSYLVGFLNATFNSMSKLPKKFRTGNYVLMQNLIENQFSMINIKGKSTLK